MRAASSARKSTSCHRGGAESHVARRIFDDIRTAERVLHLADVSGHDAQRFVVIRKRQQVVQVRAPMCGPCKVAGDEERIDFVDETSNPCEMIAIHAFRTAHG